MAVVIRMKRTGRRNRPCYRISVADSRWPRDGRVLETLGVYDPVSGKTESQVTLNVERAQHWLSVGATPSETVHSLFKRHEVYVGDFARKPKPTRKRKGRDGKSKTTQKRRADQKIRTDRKAVRQSERIAGKRAAAKAEAASSDE